MNSIKEMVKDKKVKFLFYREHELWYTTECGFEFPVPTNDVGTAAMNAEDKAILFMRWIRKHMEMLEGAKKEKSTFQQEWDGNLMLLHCATPFERIPSSEQLERAEKAKGNKK